MRFAQTSFLLRARPPLTVSNSPLLWLPVSPQRPSLFRPKTQSPLKAGGAASSRRLPGELCLPPSLLVQAGSKFSGNHCTGQFPGPSRSKLGLETSSLPSRPGRVKGVRRKPLAIGAPKGALLELGRDLNQGQEPVVA